MFSNLYFHYYVWILNGIFQKIVFLAVVTLTRIIVSAHISLLDYQETDELSTEKQRIKSIARDIQK